MGLIRQLLEGWPFSGRDLQGLDVLQAHADRAKEYLRGVVAESHPTTATATAAKWDTEAPGFINVAGGQDLAYLQGRIAERWPNVLLVQFITPDVDQTGNGECGVEECTGIANIYGPGHPWAYYRVQGTVQNRGEYLKLQATLTKIMPAHMSQIDAVVVENENTTSEALLAESGIEQCGA